ncbi:hypothetical protein Saga11_19000 [Bacillus safensis]|nr:hypothetical protein Saga11_19000 [Bacillus safensis]
MASEKMATAKKRYPRIIIIPPQVGVTSDEVKGFFPLGSAAQAEIFLKTSLLCNLLKGELLNPSFKIKREATLKMALFGFRHKKNTYFTEQSVK